jgi:hypothetical protein
MVKRPAQVPITRRALITRVNHKLAESDQQLIVSRGGTAKAAVGDFWVHDCGKQRIVRRDVDLEDYASEIGVLADYEKLEDVR